MSRLTALIAVLLPLPALAEAPKVVTDIAPVHSLVAMVMQGTGAPTLLIDPGTDPHHIHLRPSQARAAADADLFVWIGPDLSPGLERLAEAAGAELRLADGDDPDGHEDDHADDHGHDHSDPHGWLNPDTAAGWLTDIATTLAALDPANADTYARNARAGRDRITQVAADIDARLDGIEDRQVVVYHDAYGAFAERFDLTIAGAVLDSHAARPGLRHLSNLNDALTSGHLHCVLTEPGADPDLVANVTEGAIVTIAQADPLGASAKPGAGLYPQLLKDMGQAVELCLTQRTGG
jgi:zinc transport system substrate-binding protein